MTSQEQYGLNGAVGRQCKQNSHSQKRKPVPWDAGLVTRAYSPRANHPLDGWLWLWYLWIRVCHWVKKKRGYWPLLCKNQYPLPLPRSAGCGTWTRTVSPPKDFESSSSAIPTSRLLRARRLKTDLFYQNSEDFATVFWIFSQKLKVQTVEKKNERGLYKMHKKR